MPAFNYVQGTQQYAGRNVFLWQNFPGTVNPTTGHVKVGAGRMYYSLMHAYLRQVRERGEAVLPDRVVRMKLMREVERRCVERDADDLFTLLAV